MTRGEVGPVREGDPKGEEEGSSVGAELTQQLEKKLILGIRDSCHVTGHMGFCFD